MKREIVDYIEDIIEAMEKAMEFVENMEYEDFIKDDKTVYAVIRALEVIGEAVKNIPYEVRSLYPDIPWKEMAGIRDKLIHDYFGVDLLIIWRTVKFSIPNLTSAFDKILKDLETGD
ncbi:MAG: DUF86 domain-containing protein [Hydrogenothermaceae bacterium]